MGITRSVVSASLLCLFMAMPLSAQGVYQSLTVTPDHTTGLVAPTSGQVTEDFEFWLVNSGERGEDVEVGFSDSSSGASGTVTAVSNPVGPGQTARVTVTVEGTGGQFPYWVDFWARIVDGPETGDTVRLTIDTVGSGTEVVEARAHRAPCTVQRGPLGSVTLLGGLPGTRVEVFAVDGRRVVQLNMPRSSHAQVNTGHGYRIVRMTPKNSGRR